MLSFINSNILGPILIVILVYSSVFLFVKLRFKPFKTPIKLLRVLGREDSKKSFKAACLSLSGTLGVGNIAGVAAAIGTGGAGSVFWMWVFAFMAMIIKYSEIVISSTYLKSGQHGGAALYIRYGLKRPGISVLFSLLIILSSFGSGITILSSIPLGTSEL
jgi:AGCS family alanine or glycine:cation symporter